MVMGSGFGLFLFRFEGSCGLKNLQGVSDMDNRTKYAIQLAMLKKLVSKKVISAAEYEKVKKFLNKKYKVFDVV